MKEQWVKWLQTPSQGKGYKARQRSWSACLWSTYPCTEERKRERDAVLWKDAGVTAETDSVKVRRIVMEGHVGSKIEFKGEEDYGLSVTGSVWEINRLCFCSGSLQHLNSNDALCQRPTKFPNCLCSHHLTLVPQPKLAEEVRVLKYIAHFISTVLFTFK